MSQSSADSSTGITVEVPLRWSDMDAYGHVNNVQVVRVMEEARVQVFGKPSLTGSPGGPAPVIPLNEAVGEDTMTLISDHTVKYRRQLPYRGLPIPVTITVDKARGASVEISYVMKDPTEDQVCATATSTMVFVSATTQAPVRMTPALRELFAAYGA